MHPPRPTPFRQETAYALNGRVAGFACGGRLWHLVLAGRVQGNPSRSRRSPTPSQRWRLTPPKCGPGVPALAQISAKRRQRPEFSFPKPKLRVYFEDIITNPPRGRATCVSKPSYWRRLPCLRLQAVCRILHRAGLRALRRARFWPMSPRMTRLPARLSVAWRALQAAASTSDCPPVTDLIAARAAIPVATTGRGDPGRSFAFFCARGERCSTRS